MLFLKLAQAATLLVSAILAAPLAQATQPLTVADIFSHGTPAGDAPSGFSWSPDSARAIYLSDDGDLMQLDATGRAQAIISHTRLSALTSHPALEKDRDHRARYGQEGYIWGPDSAHILFDMDGTLVLYSPKTETGLNIGSTGQGSGDDPKFAPNGEAISYVRDHNLYLRHLRGASDAEFALTNTKEETLLNGEVDWVYEEELDVRSNYFWSPDSKHIAFLQMDEAAVPEYPIPDWIPNHASVDRQRYPQPGDPNPAVRVGVVAVGTRKTNWIKLPIVAGSDYVPRFGWVSPRTLWIETVTRDHTHRNLYFADAESGAVKLALSETDAKFFPESYDVELTANELFVTSWRDGHTHIYRYSFDAANPLANEAHLVQQLTSGDFEVGGIKSIDNTAHTVYYVSNEGNPIEQQVWSVQMDGTGKRQLTHSPGVHDAVFSSEGGLFIDTASDITTPPTVSFCRSDRCKPFWNSQPLTNFRHRVPKDAGTQSRRRQYHALRIALASC